MKKFLIVTAAVLVLAGCKREGPSEENSVNIVADNAYENMMPDESIAPPIENTAMNAANVAEVPVPPPSIDEQQQTQEDADATGMTARTDREAATEQDDATAPVERK